MSNQPTVVEFYLKGSDDTMLILTTEAVPRAGEFISISKRTYKVERVTWAVDCFHDIFKHRLRANVELQLVNAAGVVSADE